MYARSSGDWYGGAMLRRIDQRTQRTERRTSWWGRSIPRQEARRVVERKYPRLYEITPKWVLTRPERMEHGTLYIKPDSRLLWHLCACGCGKTVAVDLNPAGWRLLFDGVYVTLTPSIGCAHQPCGSHYFIRDNEIEWCPDFPAGYFPPT